jgi:hypothetical protein
MSELGEWDDAGDLVDQTQDLPAEAGAAGGAAPEPGELFYANVAEFVTDFLAPMYTHTAPAWCPQWWKHAEGVYRLEAMWRAWEYLRQEPNSGASVWLLNHADPHMAILLSSDGPFKSCNPSNGHVDGRAKRLTVEAPPRGLFDDWR